MKEKGNESSSSSLVIVSRRMLIAGIAGTALFSFGLGYFFGYGGTTPNRIAKVEADNKVIPSDERTVLDSSGKPTILPPPATPGIIPKETPMIPERNNEASSAPTTHQEKRSDTDASDGKNKNIGSGKGGENDKAVKDNKKQYAQAAKKPVHKPVSSKGEHFYTVQVGAFSEPTKADRLKDRLSAKGYKASITTLSQVSGKTLSSVRIGHYTTKKEAKELVSGLKTRGFEGVVVYGNR